VFFFFFKTKCFIEIFSPNYDRIQTSHTFLQQMAKIQETLNFAITKIARYLLVLA